MSDPAKAADDPRESELRARIDAAPDDIEALVALAVHRSEAGRFAAALEPMQRAIALRPDDLQLRVIAAGIHGSAADLGAAEREYRRALELRPGLAVAHVGLARVAEARDDFTRATREYQSALKTDPEHLEGMLGLGRMRLLEGAPEQAVQLFGRATQLYPQHARALANYGQALLARGTPEVAARPLIRALELDPALDDARLLLGHVELARGQPVAAEQAYRQVLDAAPDLAACAGLADALRAQGRFAEAHAVYAEARLQAPDEEGLCASQALCLAQVGRVDDAQAELRAFIARHPRASSPRLLLADIADRGADAGAALAMWRDAAARDPDDVLAHAELALRLEAAGDLAGADAAAVRTGTDPRPDIALLRARRAWRGGDHAGAQRELLAIEARGLPPPLMRERYRLLGLVHDHNARYAEAVLSFREAHRAEPAAMPPLVDPARLTTLLEAQLAAAPLESPRFAAPILLLGLPGSGVERIAALLADQNDLVLREDRFGGQFDFFGDANEPSLLAPLSQAQLAVQARRYARVLERRFGAVPERIVDWIPAFDARVLAAARRVLPGVKAILVEAPPEQAFLDWLGFGYHRNFRIADAADAARWWRLARAQLELAANVLPVHRIDANAVLADPAAGAGSELAAFIGIDAITAGPRSAAREADVAGLPRRFAPDRFHNYRAALADAFAIVRS